MDEGFDGLDFRRTGAEWREQIFKRVETIGDGFQDVINDAASRVMGLSWSSLGVREERKVFEDLRIALPIVLRNSGYNFPLNFVDSEDPREARLLSNLPPHCKVKYEESGRYWLVLRRPLEIDEAQFIRDWLWMQLPAYVCKLEGLDREASYVWFMARDSLGEWERLCDRVDEGDKKIDFDKRRVGDSNFSLN